MLKMFAKRYGEYPVERAVVDGSNSILERLENPSNGKWTILATHPNGQSCLHLSGEAWEKVDPPPVMPEGTAL